MKTRVVAGAPNEARYGFSQAVAAGVGVAVAGQVGKDNRTGLMVDDEVELQVRAAVANVREAAAVAGATGLLALTAHLAVPVHVGLPLLERALADDHVPALTVVRVAALSHRVYRAELSASAASEGEGPLRRIDAIDSTALPWAPAAVVSGADVYVSACHGLGPDAGAALAHALDGVGQVLAQAGCALADVLSEHVYVVGPVTDSEFQAICDAHAAAYALGAPASTLVLVDELVGGARVAVTVTARRASLDNDIASTL